MEKYYVIQEFDCYYVIESEAFNGNPNEIICECQDKGWADVIAHNLAKAHQEMEIDS